MQELERPAIVKEEQSVLGMVKQVKNLIDGAAKDELSALEKSVNAGILLRQIRPLCEVGEWTEHLERIGITRQKADENMRISELPQKELAKCKTKADAIRLICTGPVHSLPGASSTGHVADIHPGNSETPHVRDTPPAVSVNGAPVAYGATENNRLRALYGPGSDDDAYEKNGKPSTNGTVPTRQADPPTEETAHGELMDALGNKVPKKLRDVFAGNTEKLTEAKEALRKVRLTIRNLRHWNLHMHYFEMEKKLDELIEDCKNGLPYCLCDVCGGTGKDKCRRCTGQGWLTKWKSEQPMKE